MGSLLLPREDANGLDLCHWHKSRPRIRRDGGWTAGVGASYRVLRFRLSDTGPVSNGVGQESGVPVFLRVTRNFTDQMALHLYGGGVAGGKLRVENSSGNKLREKDFDPPLFGTTFIGRF